MRKSFFALFLCVSFNANAGVFSTIGKAAVDAVDSVGSKILNHTDDAAKHSPDSPSIPKSTGSKILHSDDALKADSPSFSEKLSQMRKTIARRLSESKFTAPHFYLTMEINMDAAMEARKQMNEGEEVLISYNDMMVKACASALRAYPGVNCSWLEDKITYHQEINIGVAVAVDEGLLVPVLKFADTKSVAQIATESKILARKAKAKQLMPEEMQGQTFTVSSPTVVEGDSGTSNANITVKITPKIILLQLLSLNIRYLLKSLPQLHVEILRPLP